MTQPTGSIRSLFYPLNRNADIESETPNDGVPNITLEGWTTDDADERIDVVLNLSLNEYVALATCIDVGRDIAYGDNSLYLWWIWTRCLLSMSICDSIIACINDPESGVADAINSIVSSNNVVNNISYAQGQNELQFATGENPACDLDILWAQAFGIVETLDTYNLEALAILEELNNGLEWLAEVMGGALGAASQWITAGTEWAAFIINSIQENYATQATLSYKQDLACEIFCEAQLRGCYITPELLFDIWVARLNGAITIESLINESLEFIFTGSWVGTEIADAMFLSQAAFRSQWGQWLDYLGWNSIDLIARLYVNDANDDWTLLCSECGWEYVFDFDNVDYSAFWTPTDETYPPVWIDGGGVEGGRDSLGCRAGLYFPFSTDIEVTFAEAEMTYYNTAANTRNQGLVLSDVEFFDQITSNRLCNETDSPAGVGSRNYECNTGWDNVQSVAIVFGSRTGNSSWSRVNRLTVRGVGTNPFESYP